MIGKVMRGTNVAGLLRYLYGPGKREEHLNPRLVAAWRDPVALLDPPFQPSSVEGARARRHLAGLLNQPVQALGEEGDDRPVWHCVVRAAPEDPELADERWGKIACQVMHHTGLSPHGQEARAVRWLAVRHADDHIHIAATLARQDGGKPKVWNDYYRVREVCRSVEEELGLRKTPPGDRTAARRPTRAEMEKAIRHGWAKPERALLQRRVSVAAAGARTEAHFLARLEAAGVQVSTRARDSGQAIGYAVALKPQGPGHEPIWLSGGQLAADLSLPKLQHRWEPSTDIPAGERLSTRAAEVALRAAVRQVVADANDEQGFFAALRDQGVLVRLRHGPVRPEEVTGYAVSLPEYVDADGEQLWVGGGELSAELALPHLRQRWQLTKTLPREETLTREVTLTREERQAIYAEASAATGWAARQMADDPLQACDAAWAAADVLRVAGQALDNDQLRLAAAAFDRAGRHPFGRFPPRSAAGARLRSAARLMAMVNIALHDQNLATTTLITNLAALAVAVSELRDYQNRPAQAAGARRAAAHLATRPATPRATPNGHRHAQAPPSVDAAHLSAADFPASASRGAAARPSPAPGRVQPPHTSKEGR
ncbi:relaxase/mobilization nuclease domain-containing protein [Nonomuraea sp. NPDC050556]|uniref:relaxase/mobilization nuclease domain-containing protein n=1 Tax=Nonomuraea sp. NPDC050556 TaxID=3364369 RepID=UPI0037B66D67